jgi:TRAP-type mannitol/chloroaromatic compound transport system permease large subunit
MVRGPRPAAGAIIVLMAIGMPVALAFLAANILGAWIFMGGERGVIQLLNNGFGSLTTFALVPIPLFLLMGEMFFHTGLGNGACSTPSTGCWAACRGGCPTSRCWAAPVSRRSRARRWAPPRCSARSWCPR